MNWLGPLKDLFTLGDWASIGLVILMALAGRAILKDDPNYTDSPW